MTKLEELVIEEKPEQCEDSWKIQKLVAFLKGEIDVLNFNKV